MTLSQLRASLKTWTKRAAKARAEWKAAIATEKRRTTPESKARARAARVSAFRALEAAKALIGRRERQVAASGIDPDAIRHVCPHLSADAAERIASALGPAFRRYGITTPRRAAAAVAQMAHESAGFRTTTEFASGEAYEGRRDLGNVHPGDGRRFKGRGYIQITGRSNYQRASLIFGVDFVAHPTRLALPKYAALASCEWWASHGCNALADGGLESFVALTRRINGGTNGLADRQANYRRARAVAGRLVP